MAMDMLKRSLELLTHSTVSTASNYFSNVSQIVTDSKQIATGVKDAVKKPVDFVRGMINKSRGGGLYKLATDWFYQRSNEFDSFDLSDDDDEFDAGFGDETPGNEEETASASLDTKAMKDIARGQVGAMYQIGQKQAEANLANTAEIVTSLNSRSLEVIAAINNMTKSVINIDKNLANLVKAYAGVTEKDQYEYEEGSNPFSGGQLTIGKVAESLKNAASENILISGAQILLGAMKDAGPSALTDLLIENIADKIKIGDKSLSEHADSINEAIGNFMHNQFSKLLDWEPFKNYIGDFGYLGKNISGPIKNDYNRKKATFDGMTRKTIVEIIPQYLSKITTALTGKIYSIDKKGKMTEKSVDYVKDTMSTTVTSSAFSYDIINTAKRNGDIEYKNRRNFNDKLIDQMQQWLTTGYVAYCFENYGRILPYDKLKSDELREYAIQFAWESYERYYNGHQNEVSESDFRHVCGRLLYYQLATTEGQAAFEQGVQRVIDNIRNAGRKLGKEGFDPGQASRQNLMMWQDSHFRAHSVYNTLTAEKRQSIENDVDSGFRGTDEYKAWKNRNGLGRAQKQQYEQLEDVKRFKAMSDAEKQQLIDGVTITENGTSRAATLADLTGSDDKLSEFGLKRLMISRRISNEQTDEIPLANSEIRRTLYDNGYTGNIGSLVHDIYKHLVENVTKVEVVNFPGRQNNSVKQILGPDGNVISNVQSSGGQGGIPSKLNLNTRGCGPIALNDLAERMNRDGLYDPEKGTNVGDYISTASNMGMNLHPGKATQRALNGSSPNHPVTVLGSGYGFGTAPGQLHYMNIVGSDGNGNLFTSNPMYGNGKFPAGVIVNNSVLGLFGSGYAQEPLTEEEQKKVDEAKQKLSELSDSAKKKLAGMDQDSTWSKLLFVLGVRNDNIDRATESLQNGIQSIGNRAHSGRGLFGKAKDKVNEWVEKTKTNVSDDVRNGLDTAIENINRRADAIKEGLQYADTTKANISNDATISDEDKQLADQALSLMQAALQDGDGTSDLNAIKKVINKIKNNDLRQDLMNNVTGLINRSKQKDEAKPKTKIGKFIIFGIGLLKKLLSPVFKAVKFAWRTFTGFLKGVWTGVKKYGKPIMKFLLSPYIKGAAMISVGAKSIKEGLFGKKTKLADGTVVKQSGLFGEIGKGLFGYKEQNADGSTTRHQGLPEKIIRDVFTMTLGQPKALINKLFGQSINKAINKLKSGIENLNKAFGKAGAAIGKFVVTTAKWTFKITKFIITAPFKLIGTITKKLSNFVKKAGPVVKDFFKVGIPNLAHFTKQFISDKWKELKESKFGQGVKKITDKISGTKTFKNVTGTLKAVAGAPFDFAKGFVGGWIGTTKAARQKGNENIEKIFGDKKGGSDAQKTATAIADSNKTNTENLIKSNTEHTKSIMDSFKEGVSSIIEFFRGQKEEEKKEQEEANKKQDAESKKEEGSEESKKQGQNTPVLEEINENQDKQKQKQNAPVLEEINENQDKQKQRASENNTEQTQNNNNESTTESNNNNNNDNNNDTSKVSNDQQQSGGEGEGEGNGDKKASPLQRIGGLVGKIFSGVSNIFGGITKIVMTAAMQLSGFKTLVKLVKTIITTAIKPLNKLFKKLVTALKPIIKTLTSALTQMVDAVTEILCTVLETLTPFLEPLFNVVTDIFSAVGQDLISAIGGVLKLLNPLVEGVLTILIPLIKFIHGGIETFIGAIMYIVGQVLYGVGWLVSALPTGNAAGGKLEETGNNIAIQGSDKFFTGIARIVDITAPVRDPSEVITETSQTINNIDNSTVDNSTTTTVTNENGETVTLSPDMQALVDGTTSVSDLIKKRKSDEALENISGSGDSQVSYGSFMNMNKHGCGPIALAENINRRNARIYGSGDIDPRSLTVGMYNAGRYNANRGTSVADYIATGASLGYHMTAGGVNQRSLKQASPTNPITLVGSGTGFGTRSGNNHYINVIGNDGAGFSYVSNPLTGRTSRVATNNLVLNSKLGIYGSGDTKEDFEKRNNYSDYGDLESFLDAMDEKKIEVPAWYKLGYQSEDEYNEREAKMNSVDRQTVEDYYGEDEANEIFKTDDPNERVSKDVVEEKWSKEQAGDKLKGYLDDVREDIEAEVHSKGFIDLDAADRYRKKITLEKVKARFKDYPEVIEEYMKSAGITDESTSSSGKKKSVDIATASLSEVANMDWSAEGIADRYSVSSTISSLIGGLKDLASNFLSIFNTDDVSTTEGQQKYLAKLRREMGDDAFDKLRAYAFIQFAKEHPPTGVESLEPGTWGGNIYASRFKLYEYEYIKKYKSDFINNPDKFNLTAADLTAAGFNTFSGADAVSTITALLAGADTGEIGTVSGVYGNSTTSNYDAQGRITTSGTLLETKNAFKEGSKYAQNPNVGAFIDKAKNAGMTPAEIATIISTGIWEDGGEKIFGNKSITATTYDYNGQRAEGIMNWVGGSHATTVAGQLSEIHEKYFNPGSYTPYSTFRHNEFDSQDIEAYKSATGRSGFTLNWGDKYGNIINTDLIEGSEHFFRSALVPESIHNPTGVGNYVGTAVGAYNWMLDKGYFTPQIVSGTAGITGLSGNKDDLIKSAAMIYEGYTNLNPAGTYKTSLWNSPISLRTGKTRKIRPDCSGIVSASIQEMGYKLKNAGESGLRSWDFAGANSNTFILDPDGQISSDWIVLPYKRSDLQSGDITAGYWSSHGHVSLPIANLQADWPKGLDGGGTSNIKESAKAARAYLSGESSIPWRTAMGPKWCDRGGAQKIWRYIGGNKPRVNGIAYMTDPRFSVNTNSTGYDWNDGYYEDNGQDLKEKKEKIIATNFALTDTGGLKLLDQYGKQIALIYDKAGMPGAAVDDWDKKHRDAVRMSKKWQKTGHDYWMYDAVNNITGSGDTPTSSVYIPPIDSNSFLSDALLNQDSAKSVNNYYVAKDSSDEKRQELNILLNHTFNVRSESMEAILTEMLEELKKRGSARQPVAVPSPATTPSLFDNDGIPPQIDRLIT